MPGGVRLRKVVELSPEEIQYFVLRVRTSTKARPDTTVPLRNRNRLAVAAALEVARTRKSCAGFDRGVAYMDHSDRGIAKLFERAGLQWREPRKGSVPPRERLLAALIALLFVRANWPRVEQALTDAPTPIDVSLAQERFIAGSGCFARFIAQARLRPGTWRSILVSGDVSFLRMFACFAATRTDRPIGVYVRHRMDGPWVMPISVDRLFTMDAEAASNFRPPPRAVIVEPRPTRRRTAERGRPVDVGIVTDNFVGIDEVWAVAEACARHPSVTSVRIRLHPGSTVRELPLGLPPSVSLEDTAEPLAQYAERIDVALVSMSSAVPALQDLLVPCFHLRLLYSEDDLWGRRQPSTHIEQRYPTPEVGDDLTAFLQGLTGDVLDRETDSLRRVTVDASLGHAMSLDEVRSELEAFLRA